MSVCVSVLKQGITGEQKINKKLAFAFQQKSSGSDVKHFFYLDM